MTRFGSALESWEEAQAEAPATLTAVRGGRSDELPEAGSLAELRSIAWWPVLICAGLAIWTGAIYAFLRALTGSLG
jgi:hypothetical protein